MSTRLPAAADPAALRKAFARVAAKHPILRATLPGPAMEIYDDLRPDLEVERLPAAGVADVRATLAAYGTAVFDRAAGPLYRARVLDLPGGDRVLLLAFDGLIADGVTAGLVLRELAAPVPPGPTYGDFTRWQAERYGDCGGEDVAFWRTALGGVPVNRPVVLPFCLDPRGTPSGTVETRTAGLGADLAGAVGRAASGAGTTRFVVLLAGLFALLADVTGERDLSVRVRVHGRPPAYARTAGLFADHVVLRLPDVPCDPLAVAGELRSRWAAVARHQLTPYGLLTECVEPGLLVRDHRPVEVAVNVPSLPAASGGIAVGAASYERTGRSDVPGLDVLLPAGDDASVSVTYDVARFAGPDVAEFLDAYIAVLRAGLGP